MNIPSFIAEFEMQEYLSKKKNEELYVASIIEGRFKIDTEDIDKVKDLIKSKKLSIVYSHEGKILGVSSNNRWLYTLDGKVIGKEGRRYKIECLNNKQ